MWKSMRKILALLILLTGIGYFDNAQRVESQPAPINLPANTVWGRLAFGTGPAQAIPFGVLFGNLFNGGSAPTAHCLLVGEGTNALGTTCPAAAGNVFLDAGVSADPASTAISGDATIAAGGALTIAANAVTNAKAATAAANTLKGNNTSASANVTDIAIPSCSAAQDALQWVANTGPVCGTPLGGSIFPPTNLLGTSTAPTIGSCGGGSPSISNNNGTWAFEVTVGSTTQTCVINLPTVAHHWLCMATNTTTNSTNVYTTKMVPGSLANNSVTLGNYTDVAGAAQDFGTSDVLAVLCQGV